MADIGENVGVSDILTLPAVDALARKERFIDNFARVTQFLTWPFLFVVFNLVFDLEIKGRRNFRSVRNPFIIVSNHISFYDSFLFRLALGLWTPHLPLRFMAVRKFDWRFLNLLAAIGVIDFVYSLFGVFTIVPGLGIDKNLHEAREIIKSGGNVVIYPEGKIVVEKGIGPFKKGAAVLTVQTGVSVIPVSIRDRGGRLRRRISINVGGPMNILSGRSTEEITESFRAAVVGLYEGK
jgi:1-acyl-sn-glycerol-3-phosphate acyltransferase